MNIYLADDHNIVAEGIAGILKDMPKVHSVAIFNNGKELYEACQKTRPDVVFLDVDMPIWNGVFTLEKLADRFPEMPCFMLSMLNERSIIEDCIRKGAAGYLNKNCRTDELEEALNLKERPFFCKQVLLFLSGLSQEETANTVKPTEPLTVRETEILSLFCDGLSPKEISERLFISQRTVENHKSMIMQKFNVNSVGKLISVALKNKIV
ncbi:MAG: response regulator transcription factor [Bacteroidia bacterium]|nr:response regulator transcription factor [Bacteroidia bacterium]